MNPGLKLPNSPIAIVHRADSSGTTFNFTHYLSQVSPSWRSDFGEGKVIKWAGGVGASGNRSVSDWVNSIPNSIGYVEYAYVLTNDLTYACLQNSTGEFVCPSADTFSKAAESIDWRSARDFSLIATNAPGKHAYPILATTFIVMPKQPKDKGRSDAVLKFFRFGIEKGQEEAKALKYTPLPAELVFEIQTYMLAALK
jgi:phosphate transport system substrate-binding protein